MLQPRAGSGRIELPGPHGAADAANEAVDAFCAVHLQPVAQSAGGAGSAAGGQVQLTNSVGRPSCSQSNSAARFVPPDGLKYAVLTARITLISGHFPF